MRVEFPVFGLTVKQALRYLISTSIPTLQEKIMALNAAVERLTVEVQTQMQQTADALAGVQTALDNLAASEAEKTALQEALDAANAANQSAAAAVNAQADVLASDNPVVEEPVDPEPEPEPEPEPGDGGGRV